MKDEDTDDATPLSLSNTTIPENVLNKTSNDLTSPKDNKEMSNGKTDKNDTNYSEMCANQCSCEMCKDAPLEKVLSGSKGLSDSKNELQNGSKAAKEPPVSTFGEYH